MKFIKLTPYPGSVTVTRKRDEHARLYHRMFGKKREEKLGHGLTTHVPGDFVFLVYADKLPSLVHELGHVVLDVFDHIKSDPREANGEPFCYLLGHLLDEALKPSAAR